MTTSPTPPTAPDIPQVLLFGHSGAGKSALLGALFQAGEKQGDVLLGEVQDSSGRLESLRDATYRGVELERTTTELTSYVLRLRPWRIDGKPVVEPFTIVLHDCSGKAAESLMRRPDSLHDYETRAPVARAVLEADAILLLANAAADDRELAEAFAEFEAFLEVVRKGKSSAREVGGFPVFLVLTQCDRLAVPTDTRATWQARLHARSELAWLQFTAFLKDAAHENEEASPFLAFGSIDLEVAAVAVRGPRLTDAPGQPTSPFRVAELFRDCFAAARRHRARVAASSRRLKWMSAAATLFVTLLMLGSLSVLLFQPPPSNTMLSDRVTAYALQEPPAAVRLAEPNLSRNQRTLTAFHNSPEFHGLPEDLQEFVDSRLREITDYEHYFDKLKVTVAPADVRSVEELDGVEHTLRVELAFPPGYSWEETPAGLLRDKFLADVQAIREAVTRFQDRYLDLVRRGLALTLTSNFGGQWRPDVSSLFADGSRPIVVLSDPLPGSPTLPSPRGEAVTYRVPYEFERVYQSRQDWEAVRERLAHLRELADALGLTEGPGRTAAALLLPEPGPGANAATLPGARWTLLLRTFNTAAEDFRDWSLRDIPDPGRGVLAQRLDREFKLGVRYVQALILARIGPGKELSATPDGWRRLSALLTDSTTPFPEWGRLLHLYLRIQNPNAANPMLELAAFLRKPSFELKLHDFELTIPVDLSLDKVKPSGPLTIAVSHAGASPQTIALKQVGEGVRKGSATNYRFSAEGDGSLTYVPGDSMRAELAVRAGSQESKLVWSPEGSPVYEFALFEGEPRLVKATGASEPAVGVKLTPGPGTVLPRIPVLFPK